MAFKLESVVPWGRNIDEYKSMFQLTEADKKRKIAEFGDGPASFNYEATLDGFDVTSFDPIYQFSGDELKGRIAEIRETVMQQMAESFPLVDLDANPSDMISAVIEHYKEKYITRIVETNYEFQKGADRMLVIRK